MGDPASVGAYLSTAVKSGAISLALSIALFIPLMLGKGTDDQRLGMMIGAIFAFLHPVFVLLKQGWEIAKPRWKQLWRGSHFSTQLNLIDDDSQMILAHLIDQNSRAPNINCLNSRKMAALLEILKEKGFISSYQYGHLPNTAFSFYNCVLQEDAYLYLRKHTKKLKRPNPPKKSHETII